MSISCGSLFLDKASSIERASTRTPADGNHCMLSVWQRPLSEAPAPLLHSCCSVFCQEGQRLSLSIWVADINFCSYIWRSPHCWSICVYLYPCSMGYLSSVSAFVRVHMTVSFWVSPGVTWGTAVQMESFGLPCIFHGWNWHKVTSRVFAGRWLVCSQSSFLEWWTKLSHLRRIYVSPSTLCFMGCLSWHRNFVSWGVFLDIKTSLPGAGSWYSNILVRAECLSSLPCYLLKLSSLPQWSASVPASAPCPGLACLSWLMWTRQWNRTPGEVWLLPHKRSSWFFHS